MTTEAENKYPKSYRMFLDHATSLTGFTEDVIKDHLRAKFGTFTARDTGKYMNYLMTVKAKEDDVDPLEETRKKMAETVPCPICGAVTFGDLDWYGKHTKTPGWKCKSGGTTHFIEHKANVIVAKQNRRAHELAMQVLPFKSVWMSNWMNIFGEEVVNEEDIGDDPGGDQEPGRGRHGEDPGTNAGMDSVQQGDAEGVSNGAPARLGDL